MNAWNARPGHHIRFCEICGVGMGLMTLEEYKAKFVDKPGRCPICHHVAVKPPEKKPDPWLTMTDVRNRYKIKDLRSLVELGVVSSRSKGAHTVLIRERDVQRYLAGENHGK